MDVTYAVVNKARRGGGAGGRDPAPSGRGPAPLDRDHAPPPGTGPSPTPAGDAAYEVVTPQGDPARLGFNFRIGKPKGPREPPGDWTRV